jgi:hypothetical protein
LRHAQRWISRVLRLNFVAPQIVDAILDGTQPASLTASTLLAAEVPLDWHLQEDTMLAAQAPPPQGELSIGASAPLLLQLTRGALPNLIP